MCSYSWYVRPQAEGAPPPESLGQGRRAEAGRMRAGAHLPAQTSDQRGSCKDPGKGQGRKLGPARRGWAGAGLLSRAVTALATFEVPRSPGSLCTPLPVASSPPPVPVLLDLENATPASSARFLNLNCTALQRAGDAWELWVPARTH